MGTHDSQIEQRTSRSALRALFGLLAIVLTAQILLGLVIYGAFDSWADRGTFGDMFGAVNTLFSGFAFAGLIYAILLQRRELELQRRELEMTRLELKRSAQAQEKSGEALRHQVHLMALAAFVDGSVQTKKTFEESEDNARWALKELKELLEAAKSTELPESDLQQADGG